MNLLKTQLSNGLTVMIRESHTAPVGSLWAWYRVGSRNEQPGITGISHWTEHMLFKGTERWPKGTLDQTISREGGLFNGLTWYDFTAYYETLPVERISLAMDIEADRMANAVFDEREVEAERTVIISERQGNENSPQFLLEEAVSKTAYAVHPYRYEIIGNMQDLETITADNLRNHYHTYYTPNNAIIAMAGDFNAGEMERISERYFGSIPRGPELPPVTAEEPPQQEERRVVVEGAGGTNYLMLAYHMCNARHPDFFPLTVLNAILAGGSGFPVGYGGLTNRTSRLYQALVESDLSVDVSGHLTPTVDPHLFRIVATLRSGQKPAEVEDALQAQIERMQEAFVTPAELEKAQRQARALFAYSSESITNQAFWLGFSEIFADYGWFLQYLNKIQAVTAEDIQRVAQTYLQRQNRTTGWYLSNNAD